MAAQKPMVQDQVPIANSAEAATPQTAEEAAVAPNTQVAATSPTLQMVLVNQTNSPNVFAYITGLAINKNNAPFFLQADGHTPYFPANPPQIGTHLAQNVGLEIGGPGASRTVTIPQLAGGRIWFSVGSPLTFLLNPGPAIVEPSVTNPADPNYNISWSFCEFTYNSSQLFANISYVDFVGLPISLTLESTQGPVQHISGMSSNGLESVAAGLRAQSAKDGAGWSSLIVPSKTNSSVPLRILSPNNGIVLNGALFQNYWSHYVDAVFEKYCREGLSVNTQAQWGLVTASVQSPPFSIPAALGFTGGIRFSKPSAKDIFSCSTGPFAFTSSEQGALTARISAAFNRSTLLLSGVQPDAQPVSSYYQDPTTNHYARLVHAANIDHRGYAFPYDDVGPSGGSDQSGSVSSGNPRSLTVAFGGSNAHA
jgi:hypothetical protein